MERTGCDRLSHSRNRRPVGYGTNALESQLDLLYTYSQYEFYCSLSNENCIELYLGINRIAEYEVLTGSKSR